MSNEARTKSQWQEMIEHWFAQSLTTEECDPEPAYELLKDTLLGEHIMYKGTQFFKCGTEYHNVKYGVRYAASFVEIMPDWFKKVQRPPLGIRPRFIVEMDRLVEINAAVDRYHQKGMPVPYPWIAEMEERTKWLSEHSSQQSLVGQSNDDWVVTATKYDPRNKEYIVAIYHRREPKILVIGDKVRVQNDKQRKEWIGTIEGFFFSQDRTLIAQFESWRQPVNDLSKIE